MGWVHSCCSCVSYPSLHLMGFLLQEIRMWRVKKSNIWRPNKKEESEFIREARKECVKKSNSNKAENRVYYEYLEPFRKETWIRFNRQRIRWWRIFDFRCKHLWVWIETDWWYHKESKQKRKDDNKDKHCWDVSWIIVLRLDNFDKKRMEEIMLELSAIKPWWVRRQELWLKLNPSWRNEIKEYEHKMLLKDIGKQRKIDKEKELKQIAKERKKKKYIEERKDAIEKLWF